MKIEHLRIRNFRTIGQEQSIDLTKGITIVGPNSRGKTNILKAIEMIFTGYDNKLGYQRKSDKTFGITTGQTTLTVSFSGERDGIDSDFFEHYDELNHMLEEPKAKTNKFQLLYQWIKDLTEIFGVTQIVWFIWLGIVLLRNPDKIHKQR